MDCPVVVVISTGELDALESFLSAVPANSGIAFILAQPAENCASPYTTEALSNLIRRPVWLARDTMEIKQNGIYSLPPHGRFTVEKGRLRLMEEGGEEIGASARMPMDALLRSLAADRREAAGCVVLSGAGTDGLLGLREIRGGGGLVVVREPSADHISSLPSRAVAAGVADCVLPIAEMGGKVVAFLREIAESASSLRSCGLDERGIDDLLKLLGDRCGHDVSSFRMSHLVRRLERRIRMLDLASLQDYAAYVAEIPEELDILHRDIVVPVTRFFRDPDAFETLKESALTRIVGSKKADHLVRMWVPGCSTGEEAYSLAILLLEAMEAVSKELPVRIFATDIDAKALEIASAGRYPANIASDVSPARLSRWFDKDVNDYMVSPRLREMVVFSEHDLTADPTFSRLDLISCRNVFNFIRPEIHEKIIPSFHYALSPDGYLFLGPEEGVGGSTSILRPVDRRWKIFQRHGYIRRSKIETQLSLPMLDQVAEEPMFSAPTPSETVLAELTSDALLNLYAPAYAVINDRYDVLLLGGRANIYMEAPSGKPSWNLMSIARSALRLDIRRAMHETVRTNGQSRRNGIDTGLPAPDQQVNIVVRPLMPNTPQAGIFIVLFEEVRQAVPEQPLEPDESRDARVSELARELESAREYSRSLVAELDMMRADRDKARTGLKELGQNYKTSLEESDFLRLEIQAMHEEIQVLNKDAQRKLEGLHNDNSDLRTLLASTRIPIIVLDEDLNIKRFTPEARALFNMRAEDVGRPLFHLAPAIEYPALSTDLTLAVRTGIELCKDIESADGKQYRLRAFPYKGGDNRVMGLIVTLQEITDHKRAQDGLERRQLFALLNDLPAIVFLLRQDNSISFANKAFIDAFGEPNGRKCHELIQCGPNGGQACRIDSIATAVGRGAAPISCDCGANYRVRHYPFRDTDGSLQSLAIGIDTSDRRRAEIALQESEQRYRTLASNFPNGSVMLYDRDLRIMLVGGEMIRASRIKSEDIEGKTIWELYPQSTSAQIEPRLREALAGRPNEFEMRFEDNDYLCRAVPVRNESGVINGGLVVAQAFTEQKKLQADLCAAKEQAEWASKSKSEFLANMSHEIRTPINGIMGMAELVLGTKLNEEQKYYLELLQESARSLLSILNDILDFSKIEAGKLELEEKAFDIFELIQHCLKIFSLEAEKKDIELSYAITPDVPRRVIGDPGRLRQILLNLIGNALKFTSDGSIQVHVSQYKGNSAEHRIQQEARLLFKVMDTGVGIPESKLATIFEGFTQVDGSLSRKFGGSGLGLTISKRLAEMMGGWVWVESEEGRGSTFYVLVKLLTPDREEFLHLGTQEIRTTTKLPPLRLLLAEDHPINRELTVRLLEKKGHTVTPVANGREVLEALSQGKYDLVLMDVQMPEMDGITATKLIREATTPGIDANIPIIALTAHAMKGDRKRFLEAGMNEYVSKPVTMKELVRAIEHVLLPQSPEGTVAPNGAAAPSPSVAPNVQAPQPASLEEQIFDYEGTVKRVNGDMGLLMKLCRHFRAEQPEHLEKLKSALARQDYDTLEETAHTVKGASLAIGAVDVSKCALAMEHAARSRDLDAVTGLIERLQAAAERFDSKIKEIMESTKEMGRA